MTKIVKPSFEAVFTDGEAQSFELEYNELWGVKRRLIMATLSRSSEQLIEGFPRRSKKGETGGEDLLELINQITDYRDHLKAGMEITEAAIARLLAVGEYVAVGRDQVIG